MSLAGSSQEIIMKSSLANKAATILLIATCTWFLSAAEDLLEGPVVHTPLGSVRGKYVSVKGKDTPVHAYLGVPFAKPPVGPLRLTPPQPAEAWEGVRDATKQPFICVQNKNHLLEMLKMIWMKTIDLPDISEDCLYLNIYTPAIDAQLPVMVWIWSGLVIGGSASMFDGSPLAAYQDVVVVVVQYRLGALGFLSTGDENMSGNFGLLDQVAALRWVQDHITNFGGDPYSVTIFGESFGGISVSLLALSPLADCLFHRGIAQSGTAALDSLFTKNPLPRAQLLANASGCDITSTKMVADCLRSMDIDAMLTFEKDKKIKYAVTVDGHFMTKPWNELYQNHELHKIPFITGINNHEGGYGLPMLLAPPNWTEGMDREQVMSILAKAMLFDDLKDGSVKELVADEYLGNSGDRLKIRDGFTELLGDVMYTIPAIKAANAHRDAGAPVYLYEYQHPHTFVQERRPSFVRSDRRDELYTVLGVCFITTSFDLSEKSCTEEEDQQLNTTMMSMSYWDTSVFTGCVHKHARSTVPCTEEEEQLSKTMMSYWGNFARTGSPNGAGLVHWHQYGADEHYLSIGLEQMSAQHLKKDRYNFLTQTINRQQQKDGE